MSEEDATPVYAAIALAKNSTEYWRDNLDHWRQAVISALPEPDSTVTGNSKGDMAKGNCPCKSLSSMKVVRTDDGDTITVYIYDCGCNNGGGGDSGGGFWENAGKVGAADVASGVAGAAVGGATTAGPGALPGGAGAALIGSAGTAAGEAWDTIM